MTFYRRITWLTVIVLLASVSLANLFRINVVQGTLCSLGIGPINVNCPIGTLQILVGLKQISLPLFLFALLPLLSFAMFGRGFCGWICPQGAPSEWGGRLYKRLHHEPSRFLSPASRNSGRTLLLAVLSGGLLGSFIFGVPLLCYICPVGAICRGIVRGTIGQTLGAEALVVGLVLILEISLSRRGYCKYICPIGALGSILYFKKTLSIQRNAAKCGKCGTCESVCSMGNSPMADLTTPTCTNCGTCIENCPGKALYFRGIMGK